MHSNNSISVCSELYQTTLEKACQIGCSYEEPTKKTTKKPEPKDQIVKNNKKKAGPTTKKLVKVPLTKSNEPPVQPNYPLFQKLGYFGLPGPNLPNIVWTKSVVEEQDVPESDESIKEDQVPPGQNDLFAYLSKDPLGFITKLIRPPFTTGQGQDPDMVKISKSIVTMYGEGDGDNQVQVIRSEYSDPDKAFFDKGIIPSFDILPNEIVTESGKKPTATPVPVKKHLFIPEPFIGFKNESIRIGTIGSFLGTMNIIIMSISVTVFLLLILFISKFKNTTDYDPVPTSSDSHDDDDVDPLDEKLRYLGLIDEKDMVSYVSSKPPTYEETQKSNNKTPVLRVALDASTSTTDDRSRLYQEC